MSICYLALGSNLKSPERQLRNAIERIRQLPRTHILTVSSFYYSKPMGPQAQPNYINMVVAVFTTLSPDTLLSYCQSIENYQQRIRRKRWGARTIDIDLVLYDNKVISRPHLQIPHPHMKNRDFVLRPLLEVSPRLCLPCGKTVASCLSNASIMVE